MQVDSVRLVAFAIAAVAAAAGAAMPVASPDGSESWLVYHSKTVARDGWEVAHVDVAHAPRHAGRWKSP